MISGSCFTIKPIADGEWDSVLGVYRQCEDFLALGPKPCASMEMVHRDLEHSHTEGGRFCGIHDAAGTMAGIVDFIPEGFEGNPRCAFLSLLMIALPFRGMGIGREVVRVIEAEVLKNVRIESICSAVQVNNPGAIRFWQRQGYVSESEPERQPDQTTTLRLRKALRGLGL